MTTEQQPSRQELMDEAADWLARLDSGNADPEAFEAWRAADPRRASAFVQVANAAHALDRAKPVLRAFPREQYLNRRRLLYAGLSVGAATLIAGAVAVLMVSKRAGAATVVGQTQTTTLPTGAVLQLNTDSKAEWHVEEGRTHVWLRRGEIALTVRSIEQTCVLHAGDSVTVVGVGQVNARLRGKMMDLTVLSGLCSVSHPASGRAPDQVTSPVVLRANQAILAGQGAAVVRGLDNRDIQFISAWPQGELAFQGQTLETAVGEYNRYLTHKIIIADPSLASIRLGGRFSSADPKVFLDALNSSFDIKASVDDAGTIVLTK